MMHAREVAPAKLTYAARGAQCEPEHSALKASEEQWAALSFAGIHPLGPQLFEGRHCLLCDLKVATVCSVIRLSYGWCRWRVRLSSFLTI